MKNLTYLSPVALIFALLLLSGCGQANDSAEVAPAMTNASAANGKALSFAAPAAQGKAVGAELETGHAEIKERAGAGVAENDRALTLRLQAAFNSEPALAASTESIRISSGNGRIVLRGSVSSEAEKQALGKKAAEVVGNRVDNQIIVKDPGGRVFRSIPKR